MEPHALAELMLKFIASDLDEVAKMRKPITPAQAERLCTQYSRDELRQTLLEMNNCVYLNRKYRSAAQTLENWILMKRRMSAWRTGSRFREEDSLFDYEEALNYCSKNKGHYRLEEVFDRVRKHDKTYFKLKPKRI